VDGGFNQLRRPLPEALALKIVKLRRRRGRGTGRRSGRRRRARRRHRARDARRRALLLRAAARRAAARRGCLRAYLAHISPYLARIFPYLALARLLAARDHLDESRVVQKLLVVGEGVEGVVDVQRELREA
jgi:hypothetical protein